MVSKRLTDKAIKGFDPEEEKGDYPTLYDSSFDGATAFPHVSSASFGVRGSSRTGKKTFTLVYSIDGGKRKEEKLGPYGGNNGHGLSLGEARQQAYEFLQDQDPRLQETEEEEIGSDRSLRDVGEEFLEKYATEVAETTIEEWERKFEKDIFPDIGEMKMSEVSRGDIKNVLDKIAVDRGAKTSANRTRSTLHKFFEWSFEQEYVEYNPVAKTSPYKIRPEDRTQTARPLNEEEIAKLWDLVGEDESREMESLIKMLLLTGQRWGETNCMKWEDVDLSREFWSVPAEDAKNGRSHDLPLNSLAVEILRDLRERTGDSKYVFQSPHSMNDSHISSSSSVVTRLQDKLGFEFRLHGLRKTVATQLGKMGFNQVTIGKCLNHKGSEQTTTALYDQAKRIPQKREAMRKWDEKLRSIIE